MAIDKLFSRTAVSTAKKWGVLVLILGFSTGFGFIFHNLNFTEANTITVYILGALLTALFTKSYLCSVLFSFASVFLFNFFFTEPRLSFMAYESGYPVTFVIMLIASLITGTLANKLATNAKLSAEAAFRTGIMLETTRLLQGAEGEDEIIRTLAEQIKKLLNRNIIIYPVRNGGLDQGKMFTVDEEKGCKALLTPQEQTVARWVFQNRKRAGAGTDRMTDALGLYFAVKTNKDIFYVVGIQIGVKNLEPFEDSILISILGESALAIENKRNARERERIELLAKDEQLKANLLRSISHDLRTPLTSISGNAENLLSNLENIDHTTRQQILGDIYDDSQWLINLVENLLSISRINEGKMNLHMSAQLVDEVVNEALCHIHRKRTDHNITAESSEGLLLANIDVRLIVQVLINLVDNAIKYTPAGSDIKISAKKNGDMIEVSVADNGPGIPDSIKKKVFQMFYTGENKIADSHRSLGLGLSLCESIISAHGGELILADNQPHGCVFTFTLKASEVDLNE